MHAVDHHFRVRHGHGRPGTPSPEASAAGLPAHLILTGFQAAGTRGRALAEGATELTMFGHYVPVLAEVVLALGFSSSRRRHRATRMVAGLTRGPREIYIIHSEPQSARCLAASLDPCRTGAALSCQGPGRVPLPPSTWRARASAPCSSSMRGRGRGRTAQQQPLAGPSSRPILRFRTQGRRWPAWAPVLTRELVTTAAEVLQTG